MVAGVRFETPSAWTTAVSVSGSVPRTLAGACEPSLKSMLIWPSLPARAATWLLVRILPSALRMMPEPDPEPPEPLTLIFTTEGRTFAATFSMEPVAAAGTAELSRCVTMGDEAAALSWVDVHAAAPPTPAAPPTSRLATTTDAASPLPRGCFCCGASGAATESSVGVPAPNGRVSSPVSADVEKPNGDQVAGGAGGSGLRSWPGCGSCPPYGDSLLMPLTLTGESVTFLRRRWAPSKKATGARRHPPGRHRRARPWRSGRGAAAGVPSSLFTNATASSPNRSRNFLHPACGLAVTSRTTSSPTSIRLPAGRLSWERSRST